MRKILFSLVFSLLLFAVPIPASAQHGHGGGRSSGHSFAGHAPSGYAAPYAAPNRGYNRGEAYAHFSNGRFDRSYFAAHWGYGHPFYLGNCYWWGPRFYVGSYFWYGGAYFLIIDPIPYDWWYDDVYVEWVDGYGYVLADPVYPGVYFHIGVRF
jgi:hypothetical protein